jgi:type II secretory pathway pseudopilin PulG
MKTPLPFHQRPNTTRGGFSLVEIVIALSVVAFAFLSIVGLLGEGLASDQNSTEQMIATNIAAAIISDMQSSQNTGFVPITSPRFGIALATIPTATPATPLAGVKPVQLYFDNLGNNLDSSEAHYSQTNGIFQANVYTAQIQSNVGPTPTIFIARVAVSWPAQAAVPVGSVEVVTQFQLHSN